MNRPPGGIEGARHDRKEKFVGGWKSLPLPCDFAPVMSKMDFVR